MRKILLPLAILLTLGASPARAGVNISISLGLPVAPPLVVVAPGIQVVEGFGEEVFFQGGWYWCRRPDGWYRSRSPQARFAWVEGRRVPPGLMRFPAGQYRNWHHDAPRMAERGPARREVREERRDGRREEGERRHEH